MEVPLQIIVRDLPHSEALEARIREDVAKLEAFHPRIISCRVTIEKSRKQQRQGAHFEARIDVRVPGKEIAATRDHDEDVYVAVRDAFHAARRQLEEEVRVRRGEVKAHAGTAAGDNQEGMK